MWKYAISNPAIMNMHLSNTERKILEEISSADNPRMTAQYIMNNSEAYKRLFREGLISESQTALGVAITERGKLLLSSHLG